MGKCKLMGPKRGIILACVAKVPETYYNINILFMLTNLHEVKYTLSQDLKLTNIVLGLTSHSSKYPCPYGECYRDNKTGDWIKGVNRTVSSFNEHQKKWCSVTKCNRDRLKEYFNCESKPLLTCDEENTPILYKIPPPPLHTILLGPVNHIIQHLMIHYPDLVNVLHDLSIQKANYHGKSFEGNQCMLILKNIEKLNIPNNLIEFKNVLLKLKNLHFVCNSEILPCSYTKVIDEFTSAWFKLKKKYFISTPPKIHILIHHLEDYFDETQLSLLKTTDEVVESFHQVLFKRMLKGYSVKDIFNPNHGTRLLRLINRINSYNLRIINN